MPRENGDFWRGSKFTVRGINRKVGMSPEQFRSTRRGGNQGPSTRGAIGGALGRAGGGNTSTHSGASPNRGPR